MSSSNHLLDAEAPEAYHTGMQPPAQATQSQVMTTEATEAPSEPPSLPATPVKHLTSESPSKFLNSTLFEDFSERVSSGNISLQDGATANGEPPSPP